MRSRLVRVTRLRVGRPSTTRNPRSKLPPWNRAPRRLVARRFQIAAMSCSRKRIMDSIVGGGPPISVTNRKTQGAGPYREDGKREANRESLRLSRNTSRAEEKTSTSKRSLQFAG